MTWHHSNHDSYGPSCPGLSLHHRPLDASLVWDRKVNWRGRGKARLLGHGPTLCPCWLVFPNSDLCFFPQYLLLLSVFPIWGAAKASYTHTSGYSFYNRDAKRKKSLHALLFILKNSFGNWQQRQSSERGFWVSKGIGSCWAIHSPGPEALGAWNLSIDHRAGEWGVMFSRPWGDKTLLNWEVGSESEGKHKTVAKSCLEEGAYSCPTCPRLSVEKEIEDWAPRSSGEPKSK